MHVRLALKLIKEVNQLTGQLCTTGMLGNVCIVVVSAATVQSAITKGYNSSIQVHNRCESQEAIVLL